MSGPQIAIVSRRCWPHDDGPSRQRFHLAQSLVEAGYRVTIVVPGDNLPIPAKSKLGRVQVERLPTAPKHGWSVWRHLWILARWLRSHQDQLAAVYVDHLQYDAFVATSTLDRQGIPVIAMAHEEDLSWRDTARFGRRVFDRAVQATRIVCNHQDLADKFAAQGIPADKLMTILPGIPKRDYVSPQEKASARAAINSANNQLTIPDNVPLAILVGELNETSGAVPLTAVWSRIVRRWPNAHLVLVGEGTELGVLNRQVYRLNLDQRVLMPGMFEEFDDLLAAADLFVSPATHCTTLLLEAIVAGTPVVAADTPQSRDWLGPTLSEQLIPADNQDCLYEAILEVLDQSQQANSRASDARDLLLQRFPLEKFLCQHRELLVQLDVTP